MNRRARRAWLRAVRRDPNVSPDVAAVAAAIAATANDAGEFGVSNDGQLVPVSVAGAGR